MLVDLDSDEGVRIENSKSGGKIFINRNLIGAYSILVRIEEKVENQDKGKKMILCGIRNKKYCEQIYYFNDVSLVLELIKTNMDKFDIWLY
ncbi:MAG: hypothetical protein H0X03_09405 [Nitrosopumilus sp.]|nr:hypothetical protein [Nitrosopumilus sp.]